MKTRVILKSEYRDEFEAFSVRGEDAYDPETQEIYRKAAALGATEYLIVEPSAGEDLKKVRHLLQGRLRRLAKRNKLRAKIRFAVNAKDKHVVLWKEQTTPKHVATVDSIADVVVGRAKPNGRATREERRTA